jgi:hypothetical protein
MFPSSYPPQQRQNGIRGLSDSRTHILPTQSKEEVDLRRGHFPPLKPFDSNPKHLEDEASSEKGAGSLWEGLFISLKRRPPPSAHGGKVLTGDSASPSCFGASCSPNTGGIGSGV